MTNTPHPEDDMAGEALPNPAADEIIKNLPAAGVPAPTPDQQLHVHLADVEGRAKAAHDDIMSRYRTEAQDKDDLTKFFTGVSRLEKRIPALIDFGFKVSHALASWAEEKRVNTKQVKLGEIFWTPTGDVAFDIIHDPYDITPKEQPEFLKRGWGRLPDLSEKFPAVIELVMTLGTHLSMMIDNKTVSGKDLRFIQLHHFDNVVSKRPAWAFRIIDGGRLLKSRTVGF